MCTKNHEMRFISDKTCVVKGGKNILSLPSQSSLPQHGGSP